MIKILMKLGSNLSGGFPGLLGHIIVRKAPIIIRDIENEIVYKLSKPSDEYLIFLLKTLKETNIPKHMFFRRDRILDSFLSTTKFKVLDDGSEVRIKEEELLPSDFFEFIRFLMIRLYTVKIESKRSLKISEFNQRLTAFMFHIGYNQDVPLIEVRSLEEFEPSRISRLRRTNIEDLQPPRRIYIPDLVYHYQSALSTELPVLQFLSFYHIMEYFYDTVYNEELLKSVREKIIDPSFSYKKDKDLKDLIEIIKQKFRVKEETFAIREDEALELTLKKFVDLDSIKSKLLEYDSTLLEYYKSNMVSFSDGDQVNFDESDVDNIYRKLALRIYRTRNSIVHSKEINKPIFKPFKDDKDLLKEIPLIRFAAEEIIINSAEILK